MFMLVRFSEKDLIASIKFLDRTMPKSYSLVKYLLALASESTKEVDTIDLKFDCFESFSLL